MSIRLDTQSYRKDLAYPDRDPKTGYYHGYGGVRPWTPRERATANLRAILIHTTDNPQGNTHYRPEAVFLRDSADVSCAYVVSSHDESVVVLVPDEYIAWHSGDCADNDFENPTSVGVEIAWTFGKGPLPQLAIDNVSDLVRMLLGRHPSIVKIDTHRAQAVPRGRKPDPIGWADSDFYAWRDRMLAPRAAPPPPTAAPPRYTATVPCPVLEARDAAARIALGGTAVVQPGQQILVNDRTDGWLHIAPESPVLGDAGFVLSAAFRRES